MEEIIQEKNSPKSKKKRYIILAVILVLLITTLVLAFSKFREKAERKLYYCEIGILYLFEGYDEESYIEYLNLRLHYHLKNYIEDAEKYKLFLSRKDRQKLEQYKEFYNSFPEKEVEKKLHECEVLRVQLHENATNAEQLADAVDNEDISKTGKTFTVYMNGIDNAKEKLAKILKCDVKLIKEKEYEAIKLAEDLLKKGTPIPKTWKEYDTWDEYSEEYVNWFQAIVDFNQIEKPNFYRKQFDYENTLEEIVESLENNEVILCSYGDLGGLPSAVVYEECRELLEKMNIDYVR